MSASEAKAPAKAAPAPPSVPPPPRPACDPPGSSDDTSSALPVVSSASEPTKKRRRSSVMELSEGEIASHLEMVSSNVDPSKLTDIEKNCILQITAFVLCNHISRYYFLDHAYNAALKESLRQSGKLTKSTISDMDSTVEIKESTASEDTRTSEVKWPAYPMRVDQSMLTEMMVKMKDVLRSEDPSEEPETAEESRTETMSVSTLEATEARESIDLSSPPDSRPVSEIKQTEEEEEGDATEETVGDTADDDTTAADHDSSVVPSGDTRPPDEVESTADVTADVAASSSGVVSTISSALGIERDLYGKLKRPTLADLNEYRTRLCSGDLRWARHFLDQLAKYLQIDEDQLTGVRLLLEGPDLVDPSPLIAALKWSESQPWRFPLILTHFSIGLYGFYSARVRTLVREVLVYFEQDWQRWLDEEKMFGVVLKQLLTDVKKGDQTKGGSRSSWKRWAKIGTAGVIGGAAIAFTGGLAAPAVAVGFAALGLTSAGAFLATTGGAVTLTALFGAAGAGYTTKKAHNRLGDVSDFEMSRVSEQSGLSVVIGVSGWLDPKRMKEKTTDDILSDVKRKRQMQKKRPLSAGAAAKKKLEEKEEKKDDSDSTSSSKDRAKRQFHRYWARCFSSSVLDCDWRTDCYAVEWQRDDLVTLGKALRTFATDAALSGTVSTTAKVGLGYTAAGVLLSALTWPLALLSVADVIDNPWGVCMSKARDAGKILADTLEDEDNGHRPITLVGYSVGARVVFYALEQLGKRLQQAEQEVRDLEKKAREGKSVKESELKEKKQRVLRLRDGVENAVLLGAPCTEESDRWRLARSVVSDRLINCYAANDWVLKFVYRGEQMTSSIAGLGPIQCCGVDNIDVSGVINKHIDYFKQTPTILAALAESGVLKL